MEATTTAMQQAAAAGGFKSRNHSPEAPVQSSLPVSEKGRRRLSPGDDTGASPTEENAASAVKPSAFYDVDGDTRNAEDVRPPGNASKVLEEPPPKKTAGYAPVSDGASKVFDAHPTAADTANVNDGSFSPAAPSSDAAADANTSITRHGTGKGQSGTTGTEVDGGGGTSAENANTDKNISSVTPAAFVQDRRREDGAGEGKKKGVNTDEHASAIIALAAASMQDRREDGAAGKEQTSSMVIAPAAASVKHHVGDETVVVEGRQGKSDGGMDFRSPLLVGEEDLPDSEAGLARRGRPHESVKYGRESTPELPHGRPYPSSSPAGSLHNATSGSDGGSPRTEEEAPRLQEERDDAVAGGARGSRVGASDDPLGGAEGGPLGGRGVSGDPLGGVEGGPLGGRGASGDPLGGVRGGPLGERGTSGDPLGGVGGGSLGERGASDDVLGGVEGGPLDGAQSTGLDGRFGDNGGESDTDIDRGIADDSGKNSGLDTPSCSSGEWQERRRGSDRGQEGSKREMRGGGGELCNVSPCASISSDIGRERSRRKEEEEEAGAATGASDILQLLTINKSNNGNIAGVGGQDSNEGGHHDRGYAGAGEALETLDSALPPPSADDDDDDFDIASEISGNGSDDDGSADAGGARLAGDSVREEQSLGDGDEYGSDFASQDGSSIEQTPSVPEDTVDELVAQPVRSPPGAHIERLAEEQEVPEGEQASGEEEEEEEYGDDFDFDDDED